MIVVLTGYKRSGKDTVADLLVAEHGFSQKMAFSDPLWEAALALDPYISLRDHDPEGFWRLSNLVAVYGKERAKGFSEVRLFLQRLGNEASREIIHPDVWAHVMVDRALAVAGRVAVTGCRFPNEAAAFRRVGAIMWRVIRPGFASDGHASESSVDEIIPDRVIVNDGTLEDLRAKVLKEMPDAS